MTNLLLQTHHFVTDAALALLDDWVDEQERGIGGLAPEYVYLEQNGRRLRFSDPVIRQELQAAIREADTAGGAFDSSAFGDNAVGLRKLIPSIDRNAFAHFGLYDGLSVHWKVQFAGDRLDGHMYVTRTDPPGIKDIWAKLGGLERTRSMWTPKGAAPEQRLREWMNSSYKGPGLAARRLAEYAASSARQWLFHGTLSPEQADDRQHRQIVTINRVSRETGRTTRQHIRMENFKKAIHQVGWFVHMVQDFYVPMHACGRGAEWPAWKHGAYEKWTDVWASLLPGHPRYVLTQMQEAYVNRESPGLGVEERAQYLQLVGEGVHPVEAMHQALGDSPARATEASQAPPEFLSRSTWTAPEYGGYQGELGVSLFNQDACAEMLCQEGRGDPTIYAAACTEACNAPAHRFLLHPFNALRRAQQISAPLCTQFEDLPNFEFPDLAAGWEDRDYESARARRGKKARRGVVSTAALDWYPDPAATKGMDAQKHTQTAQDLLRASAGAAAETLHDFLLTSDDARIAAPHITVSVDEIGLVGVKHSQGLFSENNSYQPSKIRARFNRRRVRLSYPDAATCRDRREEEIHRFWRTFESAKVEASETAQSTDDAAVTGWIDSGVTDLTYYPTRIFPNLMSSFNWMFMSHWDHYQHTDDGSVCNPNPMTQTVEVGLDDGETGYLASGSEVAVKITLDPEGTDRYSVEVLPVPGVEVLCEMTKSDESTDWYTNDSDGRTCMLQDDPDPRFRDPACTAGSRMSLCGFKLKQQAWYIDEMSAQCGLFDVPAGSTKHKTIIVRRDLREAGNANLKGSVEYRLTVYVRGIAQFTSLLE